MTNVIKLIFGLSTGYSAGMLMTIGTEPIVWIMVALGASFLIFPAMIDIIDWLQSLRPVPVHPGTGLPFGDHGTAQEAMTWAMTLPLFADPNALRQFLFDWSENVYSVKWKAYYEWLYEQRKEAK